MVVNDLGRILFQRLEIHEEMRISIKKTYENKREKEYLNDIQATTDKNTIEKYTF